MKTVMVGQKEDTVWLNNCMPKFSYMQIPSAPLHYYKKSHYTKLEKGVPTRVSSCY